jgi:hypothetical protein
MFERAREVLMTDPGAVFGETRSMDEDRTRRFSMDLGVNLGAGASVHQAVTLELGRPQAVGGGLMLPIAWQATGREGFFPTFEGELVTSGAPAGTRMELTGTYTVPLGVIGRFGDGVLGRRLARSSLEALVQRLAARLEFEAQSQRTSAKGNSTPRPVVLREQAHSEIYVG